MQRGRAGRKGKNNARIADTVERQRCSEERKSACKRVRGEERIEKAH